MLVDSHCHLDRLKLNNPEIELPIALEAAKSKGVEHMLCVCISAENRADVVQIAERFEGISASVGIHPSDVNDAVVDIKTLLSWADHPKVVALGETGLDYYYSKDNAEAQQESFMTHLKAQSHCRLPVIVHTREAQVDTLRLIEEHGDPEIAGVLHCFTESWDMAVKAMDMNYYISLSGIVTFKNAVELKDVAKKLPLDRLLVETDSPYLAPVPYRGKPNEPKYVREVAEYIADLRGMSFEALAEATSENYFRLFSKARA